jgi:uncharacterized protein YndB with AHSA1/START domain
MSDNQDVVMVERVIPASRQAIFDLLADPGRHREIDGSGAVRDPRGPVDRLQMGSRFGMSMKMGLPYAMDSQVIEFDEPKLIAWQTTGPTRFGRHVGGRVWRYELQEVDGGTKVRETWDISQESAFTKPIVRFARSKTEQNMNATLERIEQKVTGSAEGV